MIDWGRFGILTVVRGVIAAAVAAIFCTIFPGSIPLILCICGGGLGFSSLITFASAIFTSGYTDIESGDREFYNLPEMGILGRAEDATIDFIEDIGWHISNSADNIKDKIKEKHEENKNKKANKKASKLIARMLNEETKKNKYKSSKSQPSNTPEHTPNVSHQLPDESETSTSNELNID